MAAGNYTFTIEQGATTDFEIQYKDSGSNAIDLSGQYAEMRIRTTYGGTALATLTSSMGATNLSYTKHSGSSFLSISGSDLSTPIASGSIGVYIGHTLTDAFTFDKAYYDVELTNGHARTRILQGKVKLSKDIT
tara:strand:+ start:101 stop:502 length:402 start_codon:yes stop_codon:yes gene_type:complete